MFYVDEIRGNRAEIHGETAKHLRKVLRVEEGMKFEVSDRESLWLGEVSGFGKDLVEFALLEPLTASRPPVRTHLIAALIKFDHFEWLLEKATELGVERITPLNALRSDKGLDQAALKRMERWRRILHESGQQCRRVSPPALDAPVKLDAALRLQTDVRLWLEESGGCPALLKALPEKKSQEDLVTVVAGPEGGWDPRERESAGEAGWRAVSLGTQILRAETAAIAALSVVNAAWLAET